jgi:hypothetical protein
MRTSRLLSVLLPSVALACPGPEPSPTESRPEFAVACTTPTVSANPKSVSQPAQATRQVIFTVSAACGAGAAGTWELFATRTGAVSTIAAISAGTVTLTAGQSAPVTVTYTTGNPGTGTVVLEAFIENPPAPLRKSSGTLNVTVTAAATGIPFGLFGLNPITLAPGAIWTGSHLAGQNPNTVLSMLDSASRRSVGMWFNLIGGDEQYLNTDKSFNFTKWKTTFDSRIGSINADGTSSFYLRYLPYINNGTYQGTTLLDDLAAFNNRRGPTFAQVEAMAAHSKLRFPTLPTAVRTPATFLDTISGGAPYTKLDAAWAQFRTQRGKVTAYRATQIAAARRLQLGLVFGINVTQGINGDFAVPQDSLLNWGQELLKADSSDYACGFFMWDEQYPHLTSPHMTTLANLARNHVKAPCKRRP